MDAVLFSHPSSTLSLKTTQKTNEAATVARDLMGLDLSIYNCGFVLEGRGGVAAGIAITAAVAFNVVEVGGNVYHF